MHDSNMNNKENDIMKSDSIDAGKAPAGNSDFYDVVDTAAFDAAFAEATNGSVVSDGEKNGETKTDDKSSIMIEDTVVIPIVGDSKEIKISDVPVSEIKPSDKAETITDTAVFAAVNAKKNVSHQTPQATNKQIPVSKSQTPVNKATQTPVRASEQKLKADTGSNYTKKHVRRRRNKISTGKIVAVCIILVVYVLSMIVAATHYLFSDQDSILDSLIAPDIKDGKETIKYVDTIINEQGEVETIVNVLVPDEQKQKSYNILLLGHNSLLTDVFMLVNINASTNSITIMQIPRDTWIADNNKMHITTNKINAVMPTYYNYYRSTTKTEDAYEKAYKAVANTISTNLGITIDFTVIMDLEGFRNIVDALGGVEIYVEQGLYYQDPEQGLYINIPAGKQTLNGKQAEGFVRYRQGYLTADLGRQNAQKQFLAALLAKVKSSFSISNVGQLKDLANQIIKHVDTDMSTTDMIYFAKEILKCDLSAMNMMTMPGNLASGYYVMNREAVHNVLSMNYYRYDGDIPDKMFDPDGVFNSTGDYAINNAYNLPAENVYDPSVYNGENAGDIYIPRH